MAFKIEIANDTAEALFRDILVQDYRGLVKNINEYEVNLEKLAPYEFEDLVAWRRYRDAMAIAMEYYLAADERQAIFNEITNSF
jgi:hypothetical protein